MVILHILLTIVLLVTGSQSADYIEDYFDQNIDQFNFEVLGNRTFKQRYLLNDTWWDRGIGPIFFYAGNEGDIVGFWQNTGFMFKIAPQFKALVVFVEHRYYGKSLPFGRDSFQPQNIGYLSVEQALADYAFFLKSFKKKLNAEHCPVVAFGGSYGGMLAAYMRFKYPNIVTGAIAASAPIYQTSGLISGDVFFQAVSKDFRDAGCEKQVRSAFAQIQKWAEVEQTGYLRISSAFHLCKPLANSQDYDHFLRWIRNAFVLAAMMDYPYPASFMGNFPAFPVNVMCSLSMNETRPADGLYRAVSVFYNATDPPTSCFDIYKEYVYCADPTGCGSGSDAAYAWDYQACTEINLEGGTTGLNDIFPVLPFNASMRDDYCLKRWNVIPRRNWLDVILWGADITSSSNIVFSNGNLDPWARGGVLSNISESLVAVIIEGGAHHLDLRADNEKDPPSVRAARNFETRNIENWLHDYYDKMRFNHL